MRLRWMKRDRTRPLAELWEAMDYLRDYGVPPEVTDLMDDASIITAAKALRRGPLRIVRVAE